MEYSLYNFRNMIISEILDGHSITMDRGTKISEIRVPRELVVKSSGLALDMGNVEQTLTV